METTSTFAKIGEFSWTISLNLLGYSSFFYTEDRRGLLNYFRFQPRELELISELEIDFLS